MAPGRCGAHARFGRILRICHPYHLVVAGVLALSRHGAHGPLARDAAEPPTACAPSPAVPPGRSFYAAGGPVAPGPAGEILAQPGASGAAGRPNVGGDLPLDRSCRHARGRLGAHHRACRAVATRCATADHASRSPMPRRVWPTSAPRRGKRRMVWSPPCCRSSSRDTCWRPRTTKGWAPLARIPTSWAPARATRSWMRPWRRPPCPRPAPGPRSPSWVARRVATRSCGPRTWPLPRPPALDVVGAVAFAPAGDLDAIAAFDRSPAAGPDAWSSAVALVSAWHQVYDLPLDVLTPAALALVPSLATACSVRIDEQSTRVDLRTLPEWAGPSPREHPGLDTDGRASAHLPG